MVCISHVLWQKEFIFEMFIMVVCIFKVLRALGGYLRYFLKMVRRIYVTQC